jgi:hypothetical protein
MKIKKYSTDNEILEFDNGHTITSEHIPDCCEWNYADFDQIDDVALGYEFETPLIFEKCASGFRFGNKNKMVYVPCYSSQNGYYSDDVNILYNNKKVLHITELEII